MAHNHDTATASELGRKVKAERQIPSYTTPPASSYPTYPIPPAGSYPTHPPPGTGK